MLLADIYEPQMDLPHVLESKTIALQSKFQLLYDDLFQENQKLQASLTAITQHSVTLERQIEQIQANPVLQELTHLKQESELNQQKKLILNAYNQAFTLSSEQESRLAGNVNSDFFEALDHLRKVLQNCSVLLIHNETLGVEAVQKLTVMQELAFEKLFKWIQNESKIFKCEYPEISNNLKLALHALKYRPILFGEPAVSRAFQDALTVGGLNGIPKPMEFHILDPVRFINDILAWIHQICVSDREILQVDPDTQKETKKVGDSLLRDIHGNQQSIATLLDVLDNCLKGIIPILNVHFGDLDQVERYIFAANGIAQQTCTNSFQAALSTLKADFMGFSTDSMVTLYDEFKLLLSQMKEILNVYESSIVHDDNEILNQILDAFLSPLNSLSKRATGSVLPSTILRCNTIFMTQNTLSEYKFLATLIQELDVEKSQHVMTLKREQYQFLVKEAGLDHMRHWIENPNDMTRTNVQKAMSDLDNFLIKGDVNYQLEHLNDRSLAASISREASNQIVRLYEDFIPLATANGLSDLLNRSVTELETLLSLTESDFDVTQVI